MLEQNLIKYTLPSVMVPEWPELEALYPVDSTVGRYLYLKDGRPVMMVVKLADGTDKRFFLFQNSFEARWTETKPATFLPVLYNHDAIKHSQSEPIFYVESEHEADQLGTLGLLATTYGGPTRVPFGQKHILQDRVILVIGRAGEDGGVHVNAVRDEYSSVATVRTLIVDHPSGVTPPGYRLAEWLQDTAQEDQRGCLLAVAHGERHPIRLPLKELKTALEMLPGLEDPERGGLLEAVQQAPVRSEKILLFGVGARGQIGSPSAKHNHSSLQQRTRPGIVLSNDPAAGMEPSWLVRDVLPETGAGMIYAPSMAGKSFVGIDLCYAVENGNDWAGRQVKQGRAIYVASEHSASIWRRSHCQFEAQNLERPFAIIQADCLAHRLSGFGNGVERLIEDIEHARGQDDVRLVFIDTLETIALGVEENSSSAVGQVWDCLSQISARFNCFVLVAHHTGKDGENYRGSSTLMNRPETVIAIKVSANGKRRIIIEKQRDGRSGFTAEFVLETVPGTSCRCPVFVSDWHLRENAPASHSGHPERAPKVRKGERIQSAILEALEVSGSKTWKAQMTKEELALHQIILSCTSEDSNDARRKGIERAIEKLEQRGEICRVGPYIRLSDMICPRPDMSDSFPDNSTNLSKLSA